MIAFGSLLRRRISAAVPLLALSLAASAQPVPRPLPMHDAVQDKDFYLLSLLERDASVAPALASDADISAIASERGRFVTLALHTCQSGVACSLKPFLWTDEEIAAVSRGLAREYRQTPALRRLVDGKLRASGAYILSDEKSGADLLRDAWEICARGLNDVIGVYGEGAAPRYSRIDSLSVDPNASEFQQKVSTLAQSVSANDAQLFFAPSLRLALQLLALSHRDEAGRLEPMESGVNAAAVRAVPLIHWSRYPCSVIIVPGAGPADPDTALSAMGRHRTELAVEAWHAGKAPLILVSGGFVHPAQTRFSEALEMKKALIADYHVPESAILVDPHARHTTTNLRNAAREIYRYGIPMNKPALVVSDPGQAGYIAGEGFADRCLKELGYLPYRITGHPSDTNVVILPQVNSLEEDPMDPLDP